MAAYRTVLVGTDGSESSYRAVQRAAEVAADSGATLVVMCAYDRGEGHVSARERDQLGDEAYLVVGSSPAEEKVRRGAEIADRAGVPTIQTVVRPGSPVDLIVDIAAEVRADVVVVGNRGLNSLAGRLLGSVPSAVARSARCDVLIVHTT